jgi:hypothetical protein
MIAVDLRDAACAEADRLARARRWLRAGDDEARVRLDADGPWTAVARRPSVRAVLRGRTLQLWQLAFEDANGRRVESSLVPLLVDGSATPAAIRARVDAAASPWRAEATRTIGQFASTRLAREQAIAAALDVTSDPLQPGLFDRRADRAHTECLSARTSAADEQHRRLAAVQRAVTVADTPARLLLVLRSRR